MTTKTPLVHWFGPYTLDWFERAYSNSKRLEKLNRYTEFFFRRGWTTYTPETEGIFATRLLTSPDNKWVAKFCDAGPWSADGFPAFATWAVTQTNPHLPVFKTVRRLRGGWFLSIMERLTPLPCSYSELPYYSKNFSDEIISAMWDARNFDKASREAWLANEGDRKANVGRYLGRIASKPMRALLVMLEKRFGGYACDTHEGNVMLRGTTPVVIDPYGYRRSFR